MHKPTAQKLFVLKQNNVHNFIELQNKMLPLRSLQTTLLNDGFFSNDKQYTQTITMYTRGHVVEQTYSSYGDGCFAAKA